MLHYSKLKTNSIMKDLRNNEFITTFKNKRGKYMITNKGYKVIEILEKRYAGQECQQMMLQERSE